MERPQLARDIMTKKLLTLSPGTRVWSGIGKLLSAGITGAPVVDGQRRYLGMFSEKCCMRVLQRTADLAQQQKQRTLPAARDFMVSKLTTLSPSQDVFEVIGYLLRKRISGAPVIDEHRRFLGIFSEKTSMKVLIEAAYESIPTTQVGAFMNTEAARIVDEDADLLTVAQIFIDTPYRRLEVLRDEKVVGQISRRDVIRAAHRFIGRKGKKLADQSSFDLDLSVDAEVTGPATVGDVMDTVAKTISPELDLLGIAQLFWSTPYRRFPVLAGGELLGQVSRRDLLTAANDMVAITPSPERNLLYLSSLVERADAPI